MALGSGLRETEFLRAWCLGPVLTTSPQGTPVPSANPHPLDCPDRFSWQLQLVLQAEAAWAHAAS